MAFGSFDMLHKGHEAYLKEAKSYGDYLIVIVARDESIIRFKGRKPKNDENSRLGQIKKLDFVDEAVLGSKGNIFDVLEEYTDSNWIHQTNLLSDKLSRQKEREKQEVSRLNSGCIFRG